MLGALLTLRVRVTLRRLETSISTLFGRRSPPDGYCLAGVDFREPAPPRWAFSLKDLVGDGFLWGVPTGRRTVEKRLKRKFGHPDYIWKMLKPKSTIKTCTTCGDDHLVGCLCPTCYKRVMDETKEMQEVIQQKLQLSPVEQEVVVLYKGEKDEKPDEFWQGKRIVEVERPRPPWFSKNLLQQTTQQTSTSTDVKPSDLG